MSNGLSSSPPTGRGEGVALVAPIAGLITPLSDAPDEAFSSGAMGLGIAVEPTGTDLCAPADAQILAWADAGHAVTLRLENGAECLIHVGIDSVALAGEGFQRRSEVGARVKAGQPLLTFDYDCVARGAASLCTPIVLLSPEFEWRSPPTDEFVEAGAPLGVVHALSAEENAYENASASEEEFESERIVSLELEHGLHARPASAIAASVKALSGRFAIEVGGRRANARSVSELMALGAGWGATLTLLGGGGDAEEGVEALARTIASGCGETPTPSLKPSADAAPEISELTERTELTGVGVSPGLIEGRIYQHESQYTEDQRPKGTPEEERGRLAKAISETEARIKGQIDNSDSQEVGDILTAHLDLLGDPALISGAQGRITAGESAGAAWAGSIRDLSDRFRRSGSDRIAERISDLEDLRDQVLRALTGGPENGETPDMTGAIVVAEDLRPSEFLSYASRGASGFAFTAGGATSHVSILAAAKNTPMLVAAGEPLRGAPTGAMALLDAGRGHVVVHPSEEEVASLRARGEERAALLAEATLTAHDPVALLSGEAIRVYANVEDAQSAQRARAAGAEGAGLVRTEFLFLSQRTPPSEAAQTEAYRAICEGLEGRPVTFRLLDIGADKSVPFIRQDTEENPALGVRGVRLLERHSDILTSQIRSLITASKDYELRIMAPMVIEADEMLALRQRVEAEAEGLGLTAPPLGAMVETPASALLLEQILETCDFASVGSNDLTQYGLAIDRGNAILSGDFDGLHPGILRLLDRIRMAPSDKQLRISICGGLAGDPLAAPLLIGAGLRTFSVVEGKIASLNAILRGLSADACNDLFTECLALTSAKSVRARVQERFPGLNKWL